MNQFTLTLNHADHQKEFEQLVEGCHGQWKKLSPLEYEIQLKTKQDATDFANHMLMAGILKSQE